MKKYGCLFLHYLLPIILFTQNPIFPPGVYIADPSAHVWKDGKIDAIQFK